MQKPVRYYITKTKTESGEEPTVRSVRVALGTQDHAVDAETTAGHVAETTKPARHTPDRPASVKRLVKDAIRRRSTDDA